MSGQDAIRETPAERAEREGEELQDDVNAAEKLIEAAQGAVFNLMDANVRTKVLRFTQQDLDILNAVDNQVLPQAADRLKKIRERGAAFFDE